MTQTPEHSCSGAFEAIEKVDILKNNFIENDLH
jgi:hypothetical protein